MNCQLGEVFHLDVYLDYFKATAPNVVLPIFGTSYSLRENCLCDRKHDMYLLCMFICVFI